MGSLRNYYKQWGKQRLKDPPKLMRVKYVKEFCEIFDPYLDLSELHWEDHSCKYRYTGGYGNFHMMRFSKGMYVDTFPNLNQYKEAVPDEDVYDYFKEQGNDRYGQHSRVFEPQDNYFLFPLQMTRTKDYENTIKAFKWATENKKLVLFKTHPAPGDMTDYASIFRTFFKMGLFSDYTKVVHGYRSEELVENADLVFSSDSALSLKAFIKGKPIVHMREHNMMNDIVPTYSNLDGIEKVVEAPLEERIRWLTWFYHCVCHDFHGEGYQDKLIRKLKFYEDGHSDEDLHSWKYLKNLGHI